MNNEQAARLLSSLSGCGWNSILVNDNAARLAVESAWFRKDDNIWWGLTKDPFLPEHVVDAVEALGLRRFIPN